MNCFILSYENGDLATVNEVPVITFSLEAAENCVKHVDGIHVEVFPLEPILDSNELVAIVDERGRFIIESTVELRQFLTSNPNAKKVIYFYEESK